MDNNEATITVTDTPLFITTKRNDGGTVVTCISGWVGRKYKTTPSYLIFFWHSGKKPAPISS